MSDDLERRVRRAFDEVRVPADVKRAALAHIKDVSGPEEVAGASSSARAMASEPPRESDEQAVPATRRSTSFRVVSRRAAVAIAACLALTAIGFGGFTAYAQPTAYVDISANPSIELSLNRFGIVVESMALNDDGRMVLDVVELEGLQYADALNMLAESAAFAPYVQEDSFVAISVASDDKRQAEALCAQSDAYLNSLPCQGDCSAVDQQTREAAVAAGMGVGRYRAALELMELDSAVTIEECAGMTMRELRNRIASLTGDEGASGSGAGAGAGNGNGAGNGAGAGAGNGNGTGSGAGNGNGSGSGVGAGNGNGSGAGAETGSGRGAGGGMGRGSGAGANAG